VNVAIIGTGYVGLTTGVTLAYLGHSVTCVDIDESKIDGLRQGRPPIYEPGLKELMQQVGRKLQFTVSYEEALLSADVIFISVGTPARSDGSPDLSFLFSSVGTIIGCLAAKLTPTLIVGKSTVPVGTADQIDQLIHNAGLQHLIAVASNPEFLRQGQALSDTLYPERIVAGGDWRADIVLKGLYTSIVKQSFIPPSGLPRPAGITEVPFITVDRRSAELAKYAANAFLAMKISYINEMAHVCEHVGADVGEVASILGHDARIGPAFLKAGIGYGGSCFPKDTRALHHIANTNGYSFRLLSAVIEVNNTQRLLIVEKARQALGQLQGKKIAVLGLAFKPGTDDLREAPSLAIIESLLDQGAEVYAHDPVALEHARRLLPKEVHLVGDVEDALRDAEAALLVTEWPEYLELDPRLLQALMWRPLFIDGRNALPSYLRTGIDYRGIGTGTDKGMGADTALLPRISFWAG
jgi:UDPglucose 6-dehydrogenase